MTNSGPADRIDANFNTIDYISYQVDSDEVNQTVQEWLVELGEKVAGVRVVLKERDVGKRDTDESETHDSSRQGSFTADFLPEEGGIATSAPIAELAYVLFLISCSWMVTLAPLF